MNSSNHSRRSFLKNAALAASVILGGLPGESQVARRHEANANLHVAASGNDANSGTQMAPFRAIQRAAELAQPGDVLTVHEGAYRERISPPRGGTSDSKRIVYQAAPGERVPSTRNTLSLSRTLIGRSTSNTRYSRENLAWKA